MANAKHHFREHWRRSLAKSITYRLIILILDFSVIYLITGRLDIAAGFTAVSNVYSTVAYYLHERLWDRIKWGKVMHKPKGRS